MTKQEHIKALKRAEHLMDLEEIEYGLNASLEFELEELIESIDEYEKGWDK